MDNHFVNMMGKNLEKLISNSGKMREQMESVKKELSELRIVGAAGGCVKVTMNGERRVLKVDITEDNMNDRDMLQDLLAAAINDATQKTDAAVNEKMQSSLTGALGGLF